MTFTVPARWAVALLALPVSLAVVRGVRDAGEYTAYRRDMDEAAERNAECDVEVAHLTGVIEAKLAVAAEYEAGRLTLRDAARRFLRLSGTEKSLATLRRLWPTADDDEERCAASLVQYLQRSTDRAQPTTNAHQRAVAEFEREYGTATVLGTGP